MTDLLLFNPCYIHTCTNRYVPAVVPLHLEIYIVSPYLSETSSSCYAKQAFELWSLPSSLCSRQMCVHCLPIISSFCFPSPNLSDLPLGPGPFPHGTCKRAVYISIYYAKAGCATSPTRHSPCRCTSCYCANSTAGPRDAS